MDWPTFEKQRKYAGATVPSMLRRCIGHDYCSRSIYMVTMVTEGRRRLFGEVIGCSEVPMGDKDAPRMVPSQIGEAVKQEFLNIPLYYPQIEIIAVQMMPDHFCMA